APDPRGHYEGCVVYCDGDFVCASAGSIVIARGNVKIYEKNVGNLIIEQAAKSKLVRLFTLETVGLITSEQDGMLRVKDVLAGTPADRAGIRRGDTIQMPHDIASTLEIERAVRRAAAKGTWFDLELM